MSHPLQQLRELLSRREPTERGVVVGVSAGMAKVRTSSGIGAFGTNALTLAAGDSVLIRAGSIIAIVQPLDQLPVYEV